MEKSILAEIRQALKESADEKTLASGDHYFKEEVKLYGVRIPLVNSIGKFAYDKISGCSKREIFALCDELWRSGYSEEGYIACNWSYYLREQFEPEDFAVFSGWVHNYITNWATCDTLCNHTVGAFVEMYPAYVSELKQWALSGNRWVRRAAAVTLIIPARKGLFLDDILEIAESLLTDKDDLVQKGYGWMLKAASLSEAMITVRQLDPALKSKNLTAVHNFVMAHKAIMPRTALRYAIEKMPPDLRTAAMKK